MVLLFKTENRSLFFFTLLKLAFRGYTVPVRHQAHIVFLVIHKLFFSKNLSQSIPRSVFAEFFIYFG